MSQISKLITEAGSPGSILGNETGQDKVGSFIKGLYNKVAATAGNVKAHYTANMHADERRALEKLKSVKPEDVKFAKDLETQLDKQNSGSTISTQQAYNLVTGKQGKPSLNVDTNLPKPNVPEPSELKSSGGTGANGQHTDILQTAINKIKDVGQNLAHEHPWLPAAAGAALGAGAGALAMRKKIAGAMKPARA